MRVRNIELDDNEVPSEITVVMTLDEVIAIAGWTGGLIPATGETRHTSEIYDALVGSVLNRFYSGGLDEARAGRAETGADRG